VHIDHVHRPIVEVESLCDVRHVHTTQPHKTLLRATQAPRRDDPRTKVAHRHPNTKARTDCCPATFPVGQKTPAKRSKLRQHTGRHGQKRLRPTAVMFCGEEREEEVERA
jgi:hypothetical protein